MQSIHLDGSNEVSRAGSAIGSAALGMQSAASNIEWALERHQRFLDDWLQRFEAAIEKTAHKSQPVHLSADDLHTLSRAGRAP